MLRDQFPILDREVNGQPLIYLDNAATTQKPRAVIEAVTRYYEQGNANVHRAAHCLSAEATTAFEAARTALARFINAPASREVIWTRGTTEAINLVAHSWGNTHLRAGDEIILSTLEHHANIVPWQQVALRTGAVIRVIPLLPTGELDQAAYQALLNEKTRLVALTHASNALGTNNPVQAMTAAAKAVGATVLIDGAQASPHFAIDVQAIGCDFYALSGHKLFAPTGIGALWGRESLLEAMPPWQTGGEMIRHVSFEQTTFGDLPFKFEAGTPNIAGVIGMGAAVDWLTQQDRTALERHEQSLLQTAIERCREIPGFRRIGQPVNSVSLLSFELDTLHQQDIGLLLDQQGIAVRSGHHCAMPLMQALGLPGTTRASFAFYNTLDEVERFAQALAHIAGSALPQGDRKTPTALQADAVYLDSPYGREITADLLLNKLEALRDWNSRYRELMLLGRDLPAMPDALKCDDNRVQGCESDTWVSAMIDNVGQLHVVADSDARVMRGLIALVLAALNHRSPEAVLAVDIDAYLTRLELSRHLSPSRGNGLRAVVDSIRAIAKTHS